ncbi:protein kinase, putative, partial [Bodo saltans]
MPAPPVTSTIAAPTSTVVPSTTAQTTQLSTVAPVNTTLAPQTTNESTAIPTSTFPNTTTVQPNVTTVAPTLVPNATNTTTSAPNTTTTMTPNATNTTLAPNVTTAAPSPTNGSISWAPVPTSPPVADQQTIANNIASWFPSAIVSLTAFTLNSVDVVTSLSASDSITLLSYLSLNMLIGVVVGCDSTASGTVSSLSFDSVTKVISFAIPADVLDDASSTSPQWTTQYELCVGIMGSASAPVTSKTKSTIAVKSLLTSLLGVQNTLTLRQEDYVSSSQRLFRLPLATDDSFKTDRLSPNVLNGAVFTLASTARTIGSSCSGLQLLSLDSFVIGREVAIFFFYGAVFTLASTARTIGSSCSGLQLLSLDSFVIGREVAIVMAASTVSQLWKAQQGVVCASINGAVGVAVSAIAFDSFAAISSRSTLSVNRGGNLITVHGVYAAALLSGAINSSSSFISTTTACNAPQSDFTVSLRPSLLNSSSSSSSSNVAINVSQAVLVVSTTAYFDATVTYYICISWNGVKVPVTFQDTGATVTLVAPTPDASSSDFVMVSGAAGWVDLTTYVLPAQTAADTTAVRTALALLNAGGNFFFCSSSSNVAINVSQAVLVVSTTAYFDATVTYYICISWNSVKVPVKFQDTGAAVSLVAPTPDASSSDLVMVSGAAGWVDLTTYVLPAQTAADTTAVRTALALLNAGGNVYFAVSDASNTVAQKSAVCAAKSITSLVQVASGGLVYLTSSQVPSSSIVCASDGTFLRVTSRVVSVPVADFASFNGVRFIVPDAAASLTSAILLPASAQSTQLSLCIAATAMSCTSNVTIPISSTIDGAFYAVLTPSLKAAASALQLFVGTGIDSSTKAGAFIATGALVRLDRFSGALALWKSNVGVSLAWSLTSSEALCGSGAFPFALPIENGVVLSAALQWPRAYEIVISQMGASAI